ncbi:unnamed protein product [Angiostrongylus costaricensis]|uniref:Uncharacterized protein n=1 Tax=Angiostrongylus costaricensis TaxID=334426 RepID=A0A0R3Q1Q5_ANGCS|nr:unnamed protein product [Angiostrongylus costaricensis]
MLPRLSHWPYLPSRTGDAAVLKPGSIVQPKFSPISLEKVQLSRVFERSLQRMWKQLRKI